MSYEVLRPTICGTTIRMFRGGTGQPMLFLHGAAGLSVWTPFFASLAESYDLLVPEHPGFGQSDNPTWLGSVDDLALFYLDLLAQENLSGVHLVGNSFGGWIAAELAVRDSSRLKSLTLIGPAGLRPAEDDGTDIFRWSYEESIRNLFYNPGIAERILTQQPTVESMAVQLKNQTTVVRLAAQNRLANPNLGRWLHRIPVPVHIVWGAQDKVLPVKTVEAWIKELPAAKVSVIEETGHLPHAEKADDVGALVKDHLGGMVQGG